MEFFYQVATDSPLSLQFSSHDPKVLMDLSQSW